MTAMRSAPKASRDVVEGRNNGRCQLTGQWNPFGGCNWSHRVARGRGGTWAYANGLWLAARIHAATGDEQDLSRRAGWMVHTEIDPATVPALCLVDDQPDWWLLDPYGSVRHADPDEVEEAGLNPALTLDVAVAELYVARGWAASREAALQGLRHLTWARA